MAVAVDEQVRRLDVAVHEAGPVDRVQRGGGLRDDRRGLGRIERAAVANQRAQVVAGHEPHRDVRDPVVLAGRVHRDHVRVVDAGRGARLGQKARADVVVVEQLRRDHLQRHDPVEIELERAIDDAHPAPANERLDPVSGDHRAGSELPHSRCISEPAKRQAAEPDRTPCVCSAEDRNRRPLRDPPPGQGRHLLPAARPWPAGPLGVGGLSSAHRRLPVIYVTGHRNPDTDSIASAIGYAELMRRVDPHNEYVPVRLGEVNEQTRWVLDQRAAPEPDFLPHVMLRVSRRDAARVPAGRRRRAGARGRPADGARGPRPGADRRRRRRAGGRDDRALAGAALHPRVARAVRARRADERGRDRARARGRLVSAATTPRCRARSGAWRWTSARCRARSARATSPSSATATTRSARRSSSASGCWSRATGRADARSCWRSPASAACWSVSSPLDSYVTGRMITLSAPCRALMDPNPLTVDPTTCSPTSPTRSRRSTTAPRSRSTRAGTRSGWSRARTSSTRAPARAARRPRRAGAERARRRAGGDRRDPRPPPHRLDRDHDPGAGDVRPGRLDGDARDRALPPERHGAEPRDRDAAARRDPVRHGHPQLADHDRARPRRGRVPRAGAGARGAGVRPRDVRSPPRTSPACPPTRS